MAATIAILIANGFEEAEVIVMVDIFRRLEIEVDIISTEETLTVESYHQVRLTADQLLTNMMDQQYQAVVMAGGPQGSRALGEKADVVAFLKKHIEKNAYICPFCSAGAHVLAKNNLWAGRSYVCSANNYELYPDGHYIDQDIVIDGKFISGKGLGLVFDFGFTIATLFTDAEKVDWQADHIYYNHWRSSKIKQYII